MAEQEGQDLTLEQIEAEARRLGWRPESEWDEVRAEKEGRRKPKEWLSAEEYLERTRGSVPILNERLKSSGERISRLEVELANERKGRASESKKVEEIHAILTDQQRMHKDALKRAREQGKREAEDAMQKAVIDGDTNAYAENQKKLKALHQEELDEVQEEAKASTKQANDDNDGDKDGGKKPTGATPVIERWVGENRWFMSDGVLNAAMKEAHAAVLKEYPAMDEWDQLEEAAERVRSEFPNRFQGERRRDERDDDPPPRRQPAVSRPSWQAGRGDRNSVDARFARIPKADQDAYHRQAKWIKDNSKGKDEFTKEQFLADYGDVA